MPKLVVNTFLLCILFLFCSLRTDAHDNYGSEIKLYADSLYRSLDKLQKRTALLAFDDTARIKWNNLPVGLRARAGLSIGMMNNDQRRLVHRILSASLSSQGCLKAKSIKGKSTEEIRSALEQSMTDGFKPTLAVVFLSISQDRKAIVEILDKAGIKVFGCTTNGEFTDENPEKLSIAVLLLEMNPSYFSIFLTEYPERNYRDTGKEIAAKAKQSFARPAFLVSFSHIETDAEQILFGFEEIIGTEVNVFGGGAGDDYTFKDQFVFTNDKETKQGMVVLVLDEDKIKIKGKATCGWKAIGTEKTVTRSEGNHVYTVDDVPVLDLTVKYGGLENVSPDNPNLLLEVAANLPLQLQREKGDPVMRPGLVVDWNDRSFYCSGSVPQGSKVRFSLPPDFDVMEKVVKATEELKATEMPEADALIVFSCAGRIMSLGPLINQEIEGVNKVWNVPMVGMFSNAELGRATGGNLEMHNLTTCVVALKEK